MIDRFLTGRRALVTGGVSGIGRAIALELARAGADLAIGSLLISHEPSLYQRDNTYLPLPEELERTKAEIEACGVKAVALPLDVRSTESVSALFRAAVDEFGGVDILANVAGTDIDQPLAGHPEDVWNRIIDVNLTGAFRAVSLCLPGMIERRWGRIIIIGSTAASVGYPNHAAYCAAKSGLLGLMRCTALEGAPFGVTCNVVSPATVETGMSAASFKRKSDLSEGALSVGDLRARALQGYPQGRFLDPEEIASVALYLCRDFARGLTMENITISGGALW